MNQSISKAITAAFSVVLSLAVIGCDVDQTREGELPTIDVDAKGGQMPAFDVEAPDVDMSMEKTEMPVPDVDVDMEKKMIKTPDIDIALPDDE